MGVPGPTSGQDFVIFLSEHGSPLLAVVARSEGRQQRPRRQRLRRRLRLARNDARKPFAAVASRHPPPVNADRTARSSAAPSRGATGGRPCSTRPTTGGSPRRRRLARPSTSGVASDNRRVGRLSSGRLPPPPTAGPLGPRG